LARWRGAGAGQLLYDGFAVDGAAVDLLGVCACGQQRNEYE
jgi:hypothetical protein